MRIALAQVNVTVGDLEGNRRLLQEWIEDARAEGADVVAFPELALTGYPPEDLLLQPSFVKENLTSLSKLAGRVRGITAVVGFVDASEGLIYNAAAIIADGEVQSVYHKHHLPNYGVFDEDRYFRPGDSVLVQQVAGMPLGVIVCEDLWSADGPQIATARAGASLLVHINASPYHRGKGLERQDLVRRRAMECGVFLAYVNLVGGQDELVFDGQSIVVSPSGEVIARASQFSEELLLADLPGGGGAISPELEEEEEVYRALVVGLGDYLRKNGFDRALVGISGGIDSALTAALAADALGPHNVLGVSNPSTYTSSQSISDAEHLAAKLGIELLEIPIEKINDTILDALAPVFSGTDAGIAEENIQARIRGLLWMAISNKTRRIVLATGNKSELSVGYATLYGDMAGGYAVLKDVPKTLVYRLAKWRNRQGTVIPESIIERPPTAELRPGQLDTDSLPPYEILDPILEAYVERDVPIADITRMGFDESTVLKVASMVDRAEYKRRQAPPGIKITGRAFGKDRRLPITNLYLRGSRSATAEDSAAASSETGLESASPGVAGKASRPEASSGDGPPREDSELSRAGREAGGSPSPSRPPSGTG